MRITVTGGAGFIGANLTRDLRSDGHTVRVVDNFVTGRKEYLDGLDVEIVDADIRDAESLPGAFGEQDVVIHLAAAGSVVDSVSEPRANFENNVIGTFNVLDAARRADVGKVILASTGGALIGRANPPVNESSLPKPISPYGASKLAGEGYAHAFAQAFGIRTVCFRFANVYGPFSGHKKGAITAFFKCVHDGRPIVIFGDGKATRDFLHVKDICAGLRLGVDHDVAPGSVFHLASGVETSVRQLAEACAATAGDSGHVIEHHPKRPGEVERNFANYELAHEVLGFTPRISLAEGLQNTWEWYQEYVFGA